MRLLDALNLKLHSDAPDVVSFVGGGGKSSAILRLAAELREAGIRTILTSSTHLSREQALRFPRLSLADGEDPDAAELSNLLDSHTVCALLGADAGSRVHGLSIETIDRLAENASKSGIRAILVEADGSRGRPIKAPAAHEPALPTSTTLHIPVVGMNAVGARLNEAKVHRPHIVSDLLDIPLETRLTPANVCALLLHPEGLAKARPTSARYLPLLNQVDSAPALAWARWIANRLAMDGISSLLGRVGDLVREPVVERWGPVAAVILAAGAASRMGEPKQLLRLDGLSLASHSIRTARSAGVEQIHLVLGAYAEEIETRVRGELTQGDLPCFHHNLDWQLGQSTSMAVGLDALGDEVAAALFLPVDQPLLPATLIRRLVQRWRWGADRVGVRVGEETRGAPALFSRNQWEKMVGIGGDRGARQLLQSEEVATVSAESEWLTDVDTPEAWADLVSRYPDLRRHAMR